MNGNGDNGESGSVLPMSKIALRSRNPIREIVDTLAIPKAPENKPLIPLSIGDPTKFGNLKTPQIFVDAICDAVRDFSTHGYTHSAGIPAARVAVAERYSYSGSELTADDVIIASGCSGALEIAIKALASEGDNMLVPCPGFALYQTLMESNGIMVKPYNLLPDQSWEIDLTSLENGINDKTRAIIINNPSNPCGSVFSKQHLVQILEVAERHNLPILADEIYGGIVFEGSSFWPIASLTNDVPVLSVGGIAKEFLVPGFRVGWILCYDNSRRDLSEVWKGALKLTQLIIGANTLVQPALRTILTPEPGSEQAKILEAFHAETKQQLETNANFVADTLVKVPGLKVVRPQGAMYSMIGIDTSVFDDSITDDVAFSQKLMNEEFVFVLPGRCFGMTDFFRVVLSPPIDKLEEACSRIAAFCEKHRL